MKHTLLCFLMLILSIVTAQAAPVVPSKAAIRRGCMKYFVIHLGRRGSVCDCVVRNLSLRTDEQDLAILAKAYNDPNPKDIGPDDENNQLFNFDMDVKEACIKNPKWELPYGSK